MTLAGRSGEPRSWTTFLDSRYLKIYMWLPSCILGASVMSKTTKTPLRNHQHLLRIQGWHLDDTLEKLGLGPLSRSVKFWKLMCSFLGTSIMSKQRDSSKEPPIWNNFQNLTKLDKPWQNLTKLDVTIWHASTQLDAIWHNLMPFDATWHTLIQLDATWWNFMKFDTTWHSLTKLNKT